MMRTLTEVVVQVGRIDRVELTAWIERGWIEPSDRAGDEPVFTEVDVARIRLICDLRHDLAVEEETMPLVLSLLDQLYAARRQMNALTGAVQRQPEAIRQAILDLIDGAGATHR